ncbi:SdrD B-like domain-containing protein [Actinopolymorpha pittospori]|uniref:Uncharacterized protein n=1 Tax=Actinopolymorpha pittospori TaxID=648752 RepID=A0A927RHZ6_9ACTN|nr:SdrD B-like domain-containing protein [Actinopolymorpha pittospori]MBE1605671.1 hypothetical protein [Actinopolymorpha pittospori]
MEANTVIAKIGAGGDIEVFNRFGRVNVIFDVQGYFTDSTVTTSGGTFVAVSPRRIYDTNLSGRAPLVGGEIRDIQATGLGGVPTSGVSAVAVNLTVYDPTVNTSLQTFPSGGSQPGVSTLQASAGQIASALAQVKLGAGGKISVRANSGQMRLIVDVEGYYLDSAQGGRDLYVPLSPRRIYTSSTDLAAGETRAIQISGAKDVSGNVVVPSTGVTSVVVSVTAVQPAARGIMIGWPAGQPKPVAQMLSYNVADNNVTGTAILALGTGGKLNIYSSAASGLLIDVQGYFESAHTPDLAFSFEGGGGEISYLGGNGARGWEQARATNIGTATAHGARFTFQMPPDAFPGASTDSDPAWDCDFSTSTWVCETDRDIPPGGSAFFNLYPYFPAGTVGDTRTVTGSVSTSTLERSLANNGGTTTFTYVVPPPGDIRLYGIGVVGGVTQLRANFEFDLAAAVDIYGGSPMENVSVRVPLPATVEPISIHPVSVQDGSEDANWTCRFNDAAHDRFAECTRPFWDVGTHGMSMRMKLKVNAGTPDGPLSFTATASSSTPDASVENSTATTAVAYVAQGTITGHVWLDVDRDGQRDADEPIAMDSVGKINVVPESGQLPWGQDLLSTNTFTGRYWGDLPPGRYTVVVYLDSGSTVQFTTPDQGDDATDSDIITRISDYWNPRGLSAVVEVRDGAEPAVDVGLLPQS